MEFQKNVFLSSDHHHRHSNIIKYCNRPFSSVEEMTEALIDNHNKVVKPNDTWIHLGDFAFAGKSFIEGVISRLNGRKTFIIGNHDNEGIMRSLSDSVYREWYGEIHNIPVHLYHFPIESWHRKFHNALHIHGHTHGNIDNRGLLRFDVGVDCWNMTPVHLDQIMELVPQRKAEGEAVYEELQAARDLAFKKLYERADADWMIEQQGKRDHHVKAEM